MNISLRKRQPDQCGFVDFLQNVHTKSSVGRKRLFRQEWLTERASIERELQNTEQLRKAFTPDNMRKVRQLQMMLTEVKDVENTLQHLSESHTLSEIELFEVKVFAFAARKFFEKWQEFCSEHSVVVSGLEEFSSEVFADTIRVLDPENTSVPTFYLYSCYSTELERLRSEIEKATETDTVAELQAKIFEEEERVRTELSQRLRPYSKELLVALGQIAYADLLQAKTELAVSFGLCKPKISEQSTRFSGLFNPQERQRIEQQGGTYQPTSVSFGRFPTLITGINMGGKTLTIKTVGLCQYLLQYGFHVPAEEAEMMAVSQIQTSFHDESLGEEGLSSFASEMSKMNEIIGSIRQDPNILVLIDELARTTNPREGTAIVEAMLEILQESSVPAFITTHYDTHTTSRRLRVKGLREEFSAGELSSIKALSRAIDYSLVEDRTEAAPNEALRIAEMLGIDPPLIEKARKRVR